MMTDVIEEKIELVPVAVKLPHELVVAIENAVASGRYANRSEFIRAALRLLLDKEKRK